MTSKVVVLLSDDCYTMHTQVMNWACSLCDKRQFVHCFSIHAYNRMWQRKLGNLCVQNKSKSKINVIWGREKVNIILDHIEPSYEQLKSAKKLDQTIIILLSRIPPLLVVDEYYVFPEYHGWKQMLSKLDKNKVVFVNDVNKEDCPPFYCNLPYLPPSIEQAEIPIEMEAPPRIELEEMPIEAEVQAPPVELEEMPIEAEMQAPPVEWKEMPIEAEVQAPPVEWKEMPIEAEVQAPPVEWKEMPIKLQSGEKEKKIQSIEIAKWILLNKIKNQMIKEGFLSFRNYNLILEQRNGYSSV